MCNKYRAFSAAFGEGVSPGRRLASWLLPPLALALRPGPPAKGRTGGGRRGGPAAMLLLVFIGLGSSGTRAQDETGEAAPGVEGGVPGAAVADNLYDRALDAEFAEYWERAIELFREGNALYPGDPRFPWELGNLYYSRSLYGLAWEEYRKAEAIIPYQPDLLLRLSKTAGYLNRDRVSVDYLERLLRINPDNKEAIGNLGWMYYKVHRLADGERLLSAAIERFGEDSDLSMTLGTIYSDLYRYGEGKDWYRKAIALGESLGDRVFAAVAHYNLSILEARFFRFDLSLDETNASLESQNRASGRLARGELYLRRLNLEQSRKDYEAAYEIDTSPLAKINMAQVYQISGRLEEARLYAEDCLRQGDLSWMLNYGIDPDRYKRDIHDILHKTYEGLARAEQFVPWGKTGERIRSVFRKISYRFKSAVHYRLYHKYSLAAADAYGPEIYEGGSPHLDSFIQYYNAFESYPRRAITYLNRAREFESALIPAAGPSYDLEEGALFKKGELFNRALAGLDPDWERELISRCFSGLALHGRARDTRQRAAEETFALNRGALLQAGLALPLEINLAFGRENGASGGASAPPPPPGGARRNMLRALKKAGFDDGALPRGSARYTLDIRVGGSAAVGYAADCELRDREGPGETLRRSVPLRSLSKADIYAFARGLGNMVFRAE
jgi:tetratricopeptide (TPR) repeat protein